MRSVKHRKNMKNKKLKLGELFCGPGGIGLGASKAFVESKGYRYSYSHAWANDFHADTCETYKNNIDIDPNKVICSKVEDLDIDSLDPIDVFAYGFPCNDFSNVGKKKGFEGDYGPLYSYGVKVLNKFKPKFFVAENVSGLSSSNSGNAFKTILDDLANAGNGYVLTVHKFKFEEYGIPQTRHRIIIVGFDATLDKKFKVPLPTHSKGSYLSVKSAIANIPKNAPNQELTRQSKDVVERLKYIRPGENIWQAEERLPQHLMLNVKGTRLSQIYKRLHPDLPSYTLTGSGGGGTHGYHYAEYRALTNRERARIQTFPDDFAFYGTKESVRRQIGMAVSPDMARIIFECCLKTLNDIHYDFIPASWEEKDLPCYKSSQPKQLKIGI